MGCLEYTSKMTWLARGESMTINVVLHCITVKYIILCDANCGVGAYGMDVAHIFYNREPEQAEVLLFIYVKK